MPSNLITTGFGADSTAMDVVADIDLGGKRAVVTGGSSGIGVETARALAAAGAEVTLAVRDLVAGQRTADDISATTGSRGVHVAPLDLADQTSVAVFAADFSGPLHILVNNAGVMALPERRLIGKDWETQFAVNHLGHFALAVGLRHALAAANGARIVSVSSRGHRLTPVLFDDLHFSVRPYQPFTAYGQSKTANVLFAVEAGRRWTDDGVTVNAVHPGVIHDTSLGRYRAARAGDPPAVGNYHVKTAAQGAATSVVAAASPQLAGVYGRYFEDCNEAPVTDVDTTDLTNLGPGVAPYAVDPAHAERLWEVSSKLLA
ncbi:SDR family NAD(P)-dependent oxidoreductase [Streptomyces sp. NPDC050535]|uniref:SDR family NAD(P)-dependent oxidoreductase n=1 Tax=Streptomyces sp. NPDC050535 TaxID=3365626 RepID=UPI00379DFF28